MLTKQELQEKVAKLRQLTAEIDGVMSDVVLSLDSEHSMVGVGPCNDPTSALYDDIADLEAHINTLP